MSTISAGTTTPTALSLSGDTTGALTFQVNGTTTAATITSAGNVGIGTSSPTTKLTVSSATNAGISVTDGTVTTILYNTSSANGSVGTTSNHPMAFYTNNAERMRISSTGSVGIGSTTPGTYSEKLIVQSTASTQASMMWLNPGQGSGQIGIAASGRNFKIYNTYTDGLLANGKGIDIDDNGNVGIGTASPGAKLDVQGGRSYFAANSDAFATYLRYNSSTAGVFLGSPSADAFQISKSSGAAYLNIDSSGNVGINSGTLAVGGSPISYVKAYLTGTAGSSFAVSYSFYSDLKFPSATTSFASSYQSAASTAAASFTLSNLLHFYAHPAAKGAGSTITNQYGFFAESSLTDATNNYGFFSNIASGSNRWNFYAGGTAQNYFAGNTLIATTTQLLSARLTVNQSAGGSDYGIALQDNSSNQAFIGVGGGPGLYFRAGAGNPVGTLNSSGNFVNASDIAYKTDINPISYGLDTVLALLPKSYKLIANDKPGIGFIAQEMEKIIPEVVSGEEGSKGISYGQLTAVLVKAIQELKAENDALKARIEALETK